LSIFAFLRDLQQLWTVETEVSMMAKASLISPA